MNSKTLPETLFETDSIRADLDRRVFYLRTVSDLNSELRSIIDVNELLRRFLLMAMGTYGVEKGFVLVYERRAKSGKTASLGVRPESEPTPGAWEKLLFRAFDTMENKSLSPMSVGRITAPGVFRDAGLDIDAECGFFFVIDQEFMGAVAFGSPLSGHPFSKDEIDLLATLVSTFMVYLKNARAFETISGLNMDLTRRNEELTQTIRQLTEAKKRITILEKARAHLRTLLQREAERIGKVRGLDCALILLVALTIGVLFNSAAPHGVSLLPESLFRAPAPVITAAEAGKLLADNKAVVVDARPKEFYTRKHITGAVNVPLTLFDIIYMMKLSRLDPEKTIIVYGRNISRLYDEEVASRLKKRDHENVFVLSGDIHAWEAQGYPVEP